MFNRLKKQEQKKQEIHSQIMSHNLAQIMQMIRDESPIVEIYQLIVRTAVLGTGTSPDHVYLRICDLETGQTRHLVESQRPYATQMLRTKINGITGRAMRTGVTQNVSDVSKDRDYHSISSDVKSELAVPITLGTSVLGVLNLEAPTRNYFSAPDALFVETLARLAALAESIDVQRQNAQSEFIDVKQRNELLKSLKQVNDLFPEKQQLLVEIMGYLPNRKTAVTLAFWPDNANALLVRLREGEGPIGRVIVTHRPFTGEVDRAKGEYTHLATSRSVVILPILGDNGDLLGILNVESPRSGELDAATAARIEQSPIFATFKGALLRLGRDAYHEQQVVADLVTSTKSTIFGIIDPNDIPGSYYGMLQNLVQLMSSRDIAAGFLLLRDRELHLPQKPIVPDDELWVVEAASYGNFQADAEWALQEKSITQRAILTHTSQRIDKVMADPSYMSNGDDFDNGSELIVPLIETIESERVVIGVIDLVCPTPGAFTKADQAVIEEIALYLVQAVNRIDTIVTAQRAQKRLELTESIHDMLPPIYPDEQLPEGQGIIDQSVGLTIRNTILQSILAIAKERTSSEYGVILLPEASEAKAEKITRLFVAVGDEGIPGKAKPYWPTDEGITGRIFLTHEDIAVGEIPDVHQDPNYWEYYPRVMSEIVVPVRSHNLPIGLIDLESTQKNHYTREQIYWALFCANEVSAVLSSIDLALKNRRDIAMRDLTQQINAGIRELRNETLQKLPHSRQKLRKELLTRLCEITGATFGVMLLGVNAYKDDGSLDPKNGKLIEVTRFPKSEHTNSLPILIGITQGMTGIVYREQKEAYFNRYEDRPPEFLELPGKGYRIESCVTLPIREGPQIVAVLDLESEKPGRFTSDYLAIAAEGARLASDIIVSARIHLEELQANLLRNFEIEVLSNQYTSENLLMQKVLQDVASLTDVDDGWGGVFTFSDYTTLAGLETRIEHSYTARILENVATIDRWQPQGDFDADHPRITFPLFQQVYRDKTALLELEFDKLTADAGAANPWPLAKSFLCVPLFNYTEDRESKSDVKGILAIASSNSLDLNDSDKTILQQFAQTVTIAMDHLALQRSNAEQAQNLTHDVKKAILPVQDGLFTMKESLSEMMDITDTKIWLDEVKTLRESAATMESFVKLANTLVASFFRLSDETLPSPRDDPKSIGVAELIKELSDPMNRLAFALRETSSQWKTIAWPSDIPGSWSLKGGDERVNLIKAIFLQYIENAIKYGEMVIQDDTHDSITVTVEVITTTSVADRPHEVGDWIKFIVWSFGEPVPIGDRDMLFKRSFRSSSPQIQAKQGSGIGLYQVRRIAGLLGGYAFYEEAVQQNGFSLWLPRESVKTIKRG